MTDVWQTISQQFHAVVLNVEGRNTRVTNVPIKKTLQSAHPHTCKADNINVGSNDCQEVVRAWSGAKNVDLRLH